MNFFDHMGPAVSEPPAQFGGKQEEVMPGVDPDAFQVRSPYQDKADLLLGIGPGQFFQRLPGSDIAGRPQRQEFTASTVQPNAFDLSAVLSMGAPMGGVYLYTLEQEQRENRDERPLTAQQLTTPIAPIANKERIELRDETQVYLI